MPKTIPSKAFGWIHVPRRCGDLRGHGPSVDRLWVYGPALTGKEGKYNRQKADNANETNGGSNQCPKHFHHYQMYTDSQETLCLVLFHRFHRRKLPIWDPDGQFSVVHVKFPPRFFSSLKFLTANVQHFSPVTFSKEAEGSPKANWWSIPHTELITWGNPRRETSVLSG